MKSLTEHILESQTLSCRFTYKELFDSKLYVPAKDYTNNVEELADAVIKTQGGPFTVECDGIDKADNSYIIITAMPTLHDPKVMDNLIEAVEWVCNQLETFCGGKCKSGKSYYKKFTEKHIG